MVSALIMLDYKGKSYCDDCYRAVKKSETRDSSEFFLVFPVDFNTPQHLLMVKNNELCYRDFYVNVEVMNAARDSLTSIGISTPSQLHNSTNPTCLLGLNPIKLL
jgi:hypothetical protein